MVNKRTPQQSKRSPVIAEPALANRPKRNISPKSWDNSSVLSWREEQELKKALYASLHDVKRQNSDPCDQGSADNNTEPSCSYSADSTPKTKRTRSVSVEKVVQKQAGLETRRHSYGSSVKQNKAKKLKSEDRELRRRTRLSSTSTDTNKPAEYEVSTSSVTDETSQDSVNSTGSQETKRKFSAQRKFAQIHGCGYGYVYTPTTTPVKQFSSGSSCRTPPVKVFPKRAKTEDFLTFLCLRGTSALPPHMDMYNFTREDSNGADSSYPATPSNGRRHGRESSPSSSSTSVSQEEGFCPISPLKSLITPTKKAARASAGTPDVARGLATRHTKNSMRSAKQEITPVKSSPIKRTAKLTGSPTKMVKSDRIKMKKKAVATLTSMDKRSRKKSLFANEQSDGSSVKKVKFASDVPDTIATDVCSCSLLDCSACNLTNLDVVKVETSQSGGGDHILPSIISTSINNVDHSEDTVFIGNEMALSTPTQKLIPLLADDENNNSETTTSSVEKLCKIEIDERNDTHQCSKETIDNRYPPNLNQGNVEDTQSKPLHVKCKDFPIKASTCIVPKPSPPYSLIKAMRQLKNVDFNVSTPRQCQHSICYHSNNCCHSDSNGNNKSIHDLDSTGTVCNIGRKDIACSGNDLGVLECNNNTIEVSQGHSMSINENDQSSSKSVRKTLFPLPESKISLCMD